jgi:hypothetical protein
MKIVEYGDAFTTRALASNQQKYIFRIKLNFKLSKLIKTALNFRTTAVLTSGHLRKLGQIVDSIFKSGLKIGQLRQVQISHQEAYKLLESSRDKPNFK